MKDFFSNRRWWLVLSLALVLVAMVATPVLAIEFLSDQTIEIGDTNDDVYASAETIIVEGTIDGDLVAIAQEMVIEGEVTGDVIFAGALLTINGSIGDDLRAATAVTYFEGSGEVGDDALLAGYALEMESNTTVAGSLIWAGGQAVVANVAEDLYSASNGTRINGEIAGNAFVSANGGQMPPPETALAFNQDVDFPTLSNVQPGVDFGADGEVVGELQYSAPAEEDFEDRVDGEVTHFGPGEDFEVEDFDFGFSPQRGGFGGPLFGVFNVIQTLGWLLGTLVVALIIGGLFQRFNPTFLDNTMETLTTRPLASFGAGLAGYVAYLLAWALFAAIGFLGFFTLFFGFGGPILNGLGLLVSGFFFLFALTTRWLSLVFAGLWLGGMLYRLIDKEKAPPPLLSLLIGLVAVMVILAVPFFGRPLVGSALRVLALGAVLLTLWPGGRAGATESAPLTGPAADVGPDGPRKGPEEVSPTATTAVSEQNKTKEIQK
ncbi:MAG: hypothetical protein GYB68_17760 [Chloroflexi bacterium]|nr:hypothetical protein [Chloroflexota bacterium]